jgi:hypothetical protein
VTGLWTLAPAECTVGGRIAFEIIFAIERDSGDIQLGYVTIQELADREESGVDDMGQPFVVFLQIAH